MIWKAEKQWMVLLYSDGAGIEYLSLTDMTSDFSDFIKTLEGNFSKVRKCKPQASRKESAEIYLYAESFKKSW